MRAQSGPAGRRLVNLISRPAAAITVLALALIAAIGTGSGPAEASISFADEFDRSGLGGNWAWENPGGSSAYAVSGNLFNLVVTPNNDLWSHVDRAPRILRPQRPGPWTIETKLASTTGNAATFGGLIVFADSQNWLAFGWLQNESLELSGIIDGEFTGPIGVSGWYEHLRLRRIGNTYYADASRDGLHWTNVNMWVDTRGVLAAGRIGLMGKNWGERGPLTLSVDYFREHDLDVMPLFLSGAQSTRRVAQATGAGTMNRTERVNVCGTDYGIMFDWLGRTYLVFGDTRSCLPADFNFRPNSLAWTTDTNPADGLRLDGWITDQFGNARPIFLPDGGATTAVPTGAVGIGDRAFVFYMNVTSWDSAPGSWSCSSTRISSSHASDHGAWAKHDIAWGRGSFNQVAVMQDPVPGSSTLYMFGTPCGRLGSVKLMKVEAADILNKAAYRYFAGPDAAGSPVWSEREADAVTIAGGPAGEISAVFNHYLGRYVMTYMDQNKGAIVMRESTQPWGPWSAPVVLARHAQYPFPYGAFMKPGFERDGGRTFYFMMSQFGVYNTFWMETTLP